MFIHFKIATAATIALFISGSIAMAECNTANSANNSTQQKIAPITKDGSGAPVQVNPDTDTAAKAPQKDGSNTPLNEDKNLATSQQDIEAQQKGEETAAAEGEGDTDKCVNKS